MFMLILLANFWFVSCPDHVDVHGLSRSAKSIHGPTMMTSIVQSVLRREQP